MDGMSCEEFSDRLMESARHEVEPGRVLRAHMLSCGTCRERWDAEENLTDQIKALRAAAWNQRSSAASREILMERFARRNQPRVAPRWYWAFGAVAAALVAAVAVPGFEHRFAAPVTELAESAGLIQAEGTIQGYGNGDAAETAEIRTDSALDPEAEGFIAVPYVPALATGEMLRVVHTELNPAALASLGVSVDPSWTTQVPADVLLGEDGMPRAVRVSDVMSDDTTGDGSF
jgi:hypothetical protein